jgi:hypothetical protein
VDCRYHDEYGLSYDSYWLSAILYQSVHGSVMGLVGSRKVGGTP